MMPPLVAYYKASQYSESEMFSIWHDKSVANVCKDTIRITSRPYEAQS